MRNTTHYLCLTCGISLLAASQAMAQQSTSQPATERASAPFDSGDIIVTARKREETSISVPVVITAVGGAELQRRGVNSLEGIARLVPTLNIQEGGGTTQGGTISLRGISGPDTNPFADQAVSFNIDNAPIAKSSVRRLGNFDIAQVEVLKGPQTLFFGKNSPAGVISIRTADPTPRLSAKLSAGYEAYAHEIRTEGFVAGPLSDTLGGRFAFYTSDMRGWVKNISLEGLPESPNHDHGPRYHEFGLRGTLLWEPTDKFNARLKASYGKAHGDGPAFNMQLVYCPYGSPQYAAEANKECKGNNTVSHGDIGPYFTPYEPKFKDGDTVQRSNQQLVSLELNYDFNEQLKLTSVSTFYRINYSATDQFSQGATPFVLPGGNGAFLGRGLVAFAGGYYDRELTEELRLQSDFGGIFDFTVGGLFQKTRATTRGHTFANPDSPIEFNEFFFEQKGTAYSFFAQGVVRPVEGLELSGGGRYSHEEKELPLVLEDLTGGLTTPAVAQTPNPRKIKFNNFSPEITVSYRPSDILTLFASYRRGFLSGGFNSSSVDFGANPDISYGPEKVKGFEGGVKAALLDRKLRLNVAAYSYKVAGLQVTTFTNTIANISNAGAVSIKGIEGDLTYQATRNLSLRASSSYNRGKYTEYFAPCYVGQTAALGCNGATQDLAGTPLRNAPKWTASAGFTYEAPIGPDYKIGLSGDMNYTSSEITESRSIPHGRSPKRALIDTTLRFSPTDERWGIDLIGRNLTDKHYWANSQQQGFTGGGAGGSQFQFADLFASVSRGREIMLRATVKFGE